MISNTFLILSASKLESPHGHCERQLEMLGQNKTNFFILWSQHHERRYREQHLPTGRVFQDLGVQDHNFQSHLPNDLSIIHTVFPLQLHTCDPISFFLSCSGHRFANNHSRKMASRL